MASARRSPTDSPPASWWSPTAPTACAPARRSKWRPHGPRSSLRRPATSRVEEDAKGKTADESLAAFYPAAGGDIAPDARRAAGGLRRVSPAADLGATAGRLPDDPGVHVLSGREPGRDGLLRHRAARAAVRPDAGPQADALDELGRRLGDHAAVRPRRAARCSRAGRAGGNQR